MSNIQDGPLVIVLSTVGVVTTVALYVVFPLPIAWKRFKGKYLENSETDVAVDFPVLMGVPVYCYNVWGVIYVVARAAFLSTPPFHYSCLMWSYMIGMDFLVVYFFVFKFTRYMKYYGRQVLLALLCGLLLLIPAKGLIMLPYFMDIATIAYVLDSSAANRFISILNTVLGIIMYASPLPVLINRRKLENVQYFPLWLSVLFFFNALAWFLVALVASPFDSYLVITNGVGAGLGLLNFGMIVTSSWSTEIPRRLTSFITKIRERGLVYTIKSMMDVKVNETATDLELNETAASDKDDSRIQVIVQWDDAFHYQFFSIPCFKV